MDLNKNEEKVNHNEIKKVADKILEIKKEISKVISGQEKVVSSLIRAIICNGHVFVEGVPGTAKTLMVRVLGIVGGCDAKRVQFTVDLLPTDITGLTIYQPGRGFEIIKGPIFTNFLIADEINRSPPKTQSALLEAMQEKQVTIGKQTFLLPKPFFVMATANPIEQAGVYSLPEAQLDRFLFKIKMDYPSKKEEKVILKNNLDLMALEDFKLKRVSNPKEIISMQKLVKKIFLSEDIENYILDIVEATRDKKKKYSKYIEWGASPRASIALFIASKAEALMNGRNFVTPQDVKAVALEVLRHRIILNYEAESENITTDSLVKEILEDTLIP
jgi:MoxR-like ATPase